MGIPLILASGLPTSTSTRADSGKWWPGSPPAFPSRRRLARGDVPRVQAGPGVPQEGLLLIGHATSAHAGPSQETIKGFLPKMCCVPPKPPYLLIRTLKADMQTVLWWTAVQEPDTAQVEDCPALAGLAAHTAGRVSAPACGSPGRQRRRREPGEATGPRLIKTKTASAFKILLLEARSQQRERSPTKGEGLAYGYP